MCVLKALQAKKRILPRGFWRRLAKRRKPRYISPMTQMRLHMVYTAAAGLGLALCACVWWWSFEYGLRQLQNHGEARLGLASDRLVARLEQFRQLPVLLAKEPVYRAALDRADPAVNERLQNLADQIGLAQLDLVDARGRVVASSGGGVDLRYRHRPEYRRAMNGALGFSFGTQPPDQRRRYAFAAGIGQGAKIGALVAHVDIDTLEASWRADPEIIFFAGPDGVIFIANRDEMILRALPNRAAPNLPARYGDGRLSEVPAQVETGFGHALWRGDGAVLARQNLHLSRPLPVVGLEAHILLDAGPVRRAAMVQTALAAAAYLALGLGLWAAQQRRRHLSDLLANEARANQRLEEKVTQRTEELRAAQRDLVQAEKLSALGKLSAGISHELNQPLAAIRSFSENARVFLDRGNGAQVDDNLEEISQLTDRMARIIKNLRAFVKNEHEPTTEVDVVQVVQDSLALARVHLETSEVRLHWRAPAPVWVRGGQVRLQQVVVNLITNAVDAMQGQDRRDLWIDLRLGDRVHLSVRDTGPGLRAPDRIFEPFFTTKSVGNAHGMGLGLSISYGIVQSFGGDITGANHPEGGAVFTVSLSSAEGRG